MRRLIAFPCAGETLIGTLDEGRDPTGLLIVSGGNEIRAGAHRGMALLGARLAASGTPVFRYDRRGVGDSTGENLGYEHARDDLVAAANVLRREAGVSRIVAFGNCDAAALLALHGRDAGIAQVVLANPLVEEPIDDLPPGAAIRARYAARLRDPSSWLRFVKGEISLRKLARGLGRIAARRSGAADTLAGRVLAAVSAWRDDVTTVLATGDATAIAYIDAAHQARVVARTVTIPTASHSFARPGDAAALEAAIRDAIARG